MSETIQSVTQFVVEYKAQKIAFMQALETKIGQMSFVYAANPNAITLPYSA